MPVPSPDCRIMPIIRIAIDERQRRRRRSSRAIGDANEKIGGIR
jgi:hypothetical protein